MDDRPEVTDPALALTVEYLERYAADRLTAAQATAPPGPAIPCGSLAAAPPTRYGQVDEATLAAKAMPELMADARRAIGEPEAVVKAKAERESINPNVFRYLTGGDIWVGMRIRKAALSFAKARELEDRGAETRRAEKARQEQQRRIDAGRERELERQRQEQQRPQKPKSWGRF